MYLKVAKRVILKSFYHRKRLKFYVMVDVLTNLIAAITLQYKPVSNQAVHLKFTCRYFNYIQ